MKVTEKIIKQVESEIIIDLKCDCCGNIIKEKYDYYSVTIGHYDWGNDSPDSVQCQDYCSIECLTSAIKKYYEKANGSEYFNVNREIAR